MKYASHLPTPIGSFIERARARLACGKLISVCIYRKRLFILIVCLVNRIAG